MGGTGAEPPDGGTMQLDAMVDDMEEVEPPGDLLDRVSAPPPLPPKKVSTTMWIVGGLVVFVGAGAALGIGLYMMSTTTDTPETAAPEEPPPAPAVPPEDDTEEASPDETPNVVMDEFVF